MPVVTFRVKIAALVLLSTDPGNAHGGSFCGTINETIKLVLAFFQYLKAIAKVTWNRPACVSVIILFVH